LTTATSGADVARLIQQLTQAAGGGKVGARVDDGYLGAGIKQRGSLCGCRTHGVGQQRQRGQHRIWMWINGQ
jgi:hypothetical protein